MDAFLWRGVFEHDHGLLQATPVGSQCDHEADRLRRGSQTREGRALRGAERLVALRAQAALVLARVDAHVALARLSSGVARQRGAACRCGVHDDAPLLALLESVPRRRMSGPPFSLQAHLTTV